MAAVDPSLVLQRLGTIRTEQGKIREKLDILEEKVDDGFMRVSRDMSGISRHLRHHDADLEDLEKRLALLEDS